MGVAFVGQISLFPYGNIPQGWAPCNGQLLPVAQNTTLFSLLGTTYGGDGLTTFALPDLRGRIPLHRGPAHAQGQAEGQETIVLTVNEIPAHTHAAMASSAIGKQASPQGHYWAPDSLGNVIFSAVACVSLTTGAVGSSGNSAPHDNLAPFQVLNFCISLQGIYPTPGIAGGLI